MSTSVEFCQYRPCVYFQTYLTTISQLIPTHNILPATETTTMPTPFKINKKKKIKEINQHNKYAESTPYQDRRKLHQKANLETKMKRPGELKYNYDKYILQYI